MPWDFLNVHDGAEFPHRVLWDLDLWHEYRLVRNTDHAPSPSRDDCLVRGILWNSMPPDDVAEHSARLGLQSDMQGKPPASFDDKLIRNRPFWLFGH